MAAEAATTVAPASFARLDKLLPKATRVMEELRLHGETIAVAETTAGGLVSTALLATGSNVGHFLGAGVRLPVGISTEADAAAKTAANKLATNWGVEYDGEMTSSGTMEHALELAHAAKLNLGSDWGVGESGVPGPAHHRSGLPPGMGFVAVVGPTQEMSGVLKLNTNSLERLENMCRFAKAAVDLVAVLQKKRAH